MRPCLRPLVSLLLLALCVACERSPQLRPLAPDAVILAFGDSLTHGSGAPRDAAYPEVLAGLLGRAVVNAGVPGEETDAGRERLPELLAEVQPQLVILIHGGNDALRRRDPAQTRRNLEEMIRQSQAAGAEVVLLAVPAPNLLGSPPRFYADLARELRLPFDGELLSEILTDRALKSDPIHPNAAGYRRLAEGIAQLVRSAQPR